jgi:D-3-phosphoglycerate dehydrogenase
MKILITDFVRFSLIEKLKVARFEVDYIPDISIDAVRLIISQYTVVVINTRTPFDRRMIDIAKKLKLIVRLGSGLDIIDLDCAAEKGIVVRNTPEGNRQAVAEHALGLLLTLTKKIAKSNDEVRDFRFIREENRGGELEGKTLGIIGFGNTGSSFAKILAGFDIKILAFDKYKQRFAKDFRNVKETEPEQMFEECDILSFHIPLTAETVHLGDRDFFNKFKKNFVLINTSRGKNINTMHLLEALKSGKITGAGLDVLENENPAIYSADEKMMYGELFSMENVIVTPHIAGWTNESREKISLLAFKVIMETLG